MLRDDAGQSRLAVIGPRRILAISGQNGGGMPTYSIAKANDNLSKLVDEAVAGEEVAITRHGKVVVYVVSMSSMSSSEAR